MKRFIASSVEKAQTKARKALGKNVVILNIRDLPSGDVEVSAADEAGAREYYADPKNRTAPPLQDPGKHAVARTPAPRLHHDNHEPAPTNQHEERRSSSRLGRIPFLNRRKDDPGHNVHQENDRAEPLFEDSHDLAKTESQTNRAQETHDDYFSSPAPQGNVKDGEALFDRPSDPTNNRQDHQDHQGHPEFNPTQRSHNPRSPAKPIGHHAVTPQRFSQSEGGSRLNQPLEQKFGENNLTQLRDRLTGQRSPNESAAEDPATSSIANMLKPHGISDRLMAMIRNGARQAQVDDDLYRLGVGFAESFNFSPLRSTAAVPLMLVGPTGAGKTSCAAKLAALALAEGETAIMITTDVGRAGALEQFATYSDKLNIECYAAETPDEISLIMREVSPQGAVILDTPGISPYDAGDLAALKSFQTAIGAEPVLVLPASGDVGEYTDWAHAFRAFGVRACIITKFDATRRVGAGLSAAFEGNMTLTYFSETPFISEGLLPASPEFLAYRLTASYPGRIVQA